MAFIDWSPDGEGSVVLQSIRDLMTRREPMLRTRVPRKATETFPIPSLAFSSDSNYLLLAQIPDDKRDFGAEISLYSCPELRLSNRYRVALPREKKFTRLQVSWQGSQSVVMGAWYQNLGTPDKLVAVEVDRDQGVAYEAGELPPIMLESRVLKKPTRSINLALL